MISSSATTAKKQLNEIYATFKAIDEDTELRDELISYNTVPHIGNYFIDSNRFYLERSAKELKEYLKNKTRQSAF